MIARLQMARFSYPMHAIVNIALKAARDAAEVLAHNVDRLDRIHVIDESAGGTLTNMDMDSEKTILFHLHKAYPDYSIQSRVSGFLEGKDKRHVWIIDPLCGSDNYRRGISHFCVSIALATEGKVQHAVVVNPMLREEFSASRGKGAQVNTQRLRVSKMKALEGGLVTLGNDVRDQAHSARLVAMQQALFALPCDVRLTACAPLDLVWAAAGRSEAGWLGENAPESIAAATLILQESGALIGDASGSPDISNAAELIFGNPKCFKQLLQLRKTTLA